MSETKTFKDEHIEKINLVEASKDRYTRRKIEREMKYIESRKLSQTAKSLERLTKQAEEIIKTYCKGYNEYAASNPTNENRLMAVNIDFNMSPNTVNLQDLITNSKTQDITEFTKCALPDNPAVIRIMYLRVTMSHVLKKIEDEDSPLTARPGIPENVTVTSDGDYIREQLFYHAIFPLEAEDDVLNTIAKEKLMQDFMLHICCMGLDMQQLNNNNQWQGKLNKQTQVLHDRAQEVEDIFSKIGNNNTNNSKLESEHSPK